MSKTQPRKDQIERRSIRRIPCRVPVRVYADSTGVPESYLLTGTDSSPGGVFVISDLLLTEGEWMDVEYVVPGRRAPVRGRGRVVRVETAAPGPGMAVQLDARG
jgi:hypothetical protein